MSVDVILPVTISQPSHVPRRVRIDDPQEWDRRVTEMGGQVHQSWAWGSFKRQDGWSVERLMMESDCGAALAQVLIKRYGPVGSAFIPRGPLTSGNVDDLMPHFWSELVALSQRHRVVNVRVEPLYPVQIPTRLARSEVTPASRRYSPRRSTVVSLKDDADLVAGMHASKRRELRKAWKRGLVVSDQEPDGPGLQQFYKLLIETSERNQIRIDSMEHYAHFLRQFGGKGVLKLATVDGQVAAGGVAGIVGQEATYVFGASSTVHRVPGATALLQYSLMQWARDQGCTRYDLWGIPDEDPVSFIGPDNQPLRSIGNDDAGLYRFKVEFGGDIVEYPSSFEIRLIPQLWRAATYLKALGDAVRR